MSNLQLAFKILKVKELLGMPGNFGHTKRKWVNTFIFTLVRSAFKQNIIPNSQVVKEILNFRNLIDLIGLYRLNQYLHNKFFLEMQFDWIMMFRTILRKTISRKI